MVVVNVHVVPWISKWLIAQVAQAALGGPQSGPLAWPHAVLAPQCLDPPVILRERVAPARGNELIPMSCVGRALSSVDCHTVADALLAQLLAVPSAIDAFVLTLLLGVGIRHLPQTLWPMRKPPGSLIETYGPLSEL